MKVKPSFERRKEYYYAENSKILGHVLGNQNRPHVSRFIRQQHDARKKITEVLGNHAKSQKKNVHVHLCVSSRIGRNQSVCVI